MSELLVLNWGGGVNSTAMAVGFHERGIRPDLVIWSDTGGEKPGTYAYVEVFAAWLERVGFPTLVRVAYEGQHGRYDTLEEACLVNKTLPSIVYGFKACSMKHKREPIEKYENSWAPAVEAWAAGGLIQKALGFDAGESHRANRGTEDGKRRLVFPLLEWDWDRNDCLLAIERAGLPIPPKSACFFCPSSKKNEVLALAKNHPDLFDRAVAMEHAAEESNQTVKGLGRRWSWEGLVEKYREILASQEFKEVEEPVREKVAVEQLGLEFVNPIETPCGCYDGEDDDVAA
jgi:hypothetical protein